MANHRSAIKRIRQSAERRLRNRYVRSTMRTSIRSAREATAALGTEEGNEEEATAALRAAIRRIAKSASKGVIHRNQADRRISRLTRQLNAKLNASAS